MKTLSERIKTACESTKPFTKERNKALSKVKWRLKTGLLYVGLDGITSVLTTSENATVFDGRDNEALKIQFFNAIMAPHKFEVELL